MWPVLYSLILKYWAETFCFKIVSSFMTKLLTVFSIPSSWLYQNCFILSQLRHVLWKAICKANGVCSIQNKMWDKFLALFGRQNLWKQAVPRNILAEALPPRLTPCPQSPPCSKAITSLSDISLWFMKLSFRTWNHVSEYVWVIVSYVGCRKVVSFPMTPYRLIKY